MTTGSRCAGVLLVLTLIVVAGCSRQPVQPVAAAPTSVSATVTAPVKTPTEPVSTKSASATPTRSAQPPAVTTPAGNWWGVDSSGPMTDAALAAVQAWYRGATPQVWGRYLNGHYAVTATELGWARSHHIYVDLLIPDDNCSQCRGGGDICGNDETAAQAADDAQQAVAAARALRAPHGTTLFKDVEQVAACHDEPTAAYLQSWYATANRSQYRVGLYGNSTTANYAFPRAYCEVRTHNASFAHDVILDATEPEPDLGKPAGASGPHNAPAFHPDTPPCASRGATRIWQYGESVDDDNYADIDQISATTPGLIAPDGTATGGVK